MQEEDKSEEDMKAHLIPRLGGARLRLSLEYSVEFTVWRLEHLCQTLTVTLAHTTLLAQVAGFIYLLKVSQNDSYLLHIIFN